MYSILITKKKILLETPTDIDKYYFYITSNDKVVIGCETSPDVFYNKVVGSVSDMKDKKINLNVEFSDADEIPPKKPGPIDLLINLVKSI